MARSISVITNDPTQVFQSEVIEGVQDIAKQHGYEVFIETVADKASFRVEDLSPAVGIIVIANPVPDDFLRNIYLTGKPITLISHYMADMPIPAVIPNNAQGIAKLVEHLVVECHRQDFVFIDGDLSQNDGWERRSAFLKELIRHHLQISPNQLLKGDFEPTVAKASLHTFLEQDHHFDAIIASDYLMAAEAIGMLTRRGFRVPEDVSVVGFGDGPDAKAIQLTTIAANIKELGRRGARQLIGQLSGLMIRGTTLLSVQLEIRETCGFSLLRR